MPGIPREPLSSPAPRPKRIQRISLFFSESFTATGAQGAGCITYPVEMVIDPNTPTAPLAIHVLDVPKLPPELPPGEIQADPELIDRLRAAGYPCCAMPRAIMAEYWAAARGRPVKYWHPKARLVQY